MQIKISSTAQFFGRLATGLCVLAVLCAGLIAVGLQSGPRVLSSELRLPSGGSSSSQIVLNFNRGMDRRSVENGFHISPDLPGKYSWAGRSFVFTPDEILPSGQQFTLTVLKDATDEDGRSLGRDFVFSFSTPSLQFVYIGVESDEAGRLVLSDFDGKNRDVLTPNDLHIDRFAITNDRQKIYFLAYKQIYQTNHRDELYVYNLQTRDLRQIINDVNYLNKDFSLDPSGNYILLSRVQVSPTGVYLTQLESWIASTSDEVFHKFLNGEAVGTTMFSPDGSFILYKTRDGNYQLVSSDALNNDHAVFIGGYDESYGFHPFKPLLIFTKYDNTDLFSMNNFLYLFQGNGTLQKVDFGQGGLARDTVFLPNGKGFVAIFSKKSEAFDDKNSFYPLRIFHLYYYDLEKKTVQQMTDEADFSEEGEVISPDSRYVLFQRYETFGKDIVIDPAYRAVTDSLSSVQVGGQIWRLDLQTHQLVQLPIKGTHLNFLP